MCPSDVEVSILNNNQINTMGATSGAGTAYPSGELEFIPVFSGIHVTRSLVCRSLFVLLYFFF